MNKKSICVLLVLLCLMVVSACSSGTPASPGIPVTGNDNSSATQSPEAVNDNDTSAATQAPESAATEAGNTATGAMAKLNINTATESELLAAIPGLGERMVDEFLEYQPYMSIQQFREEIGKYADEAQVAEFEKYIYVPISINESDAETLQQIPGLSAEEAEALIAARPFASVEDFLTQLRASVSEGELDIAKTFLEDN